MNSDFPFDLWLNGEPHVLTSGRDFNIDMPSMISVLYQAATMRDLKIEIKRVDFYLFVKAKK